jgi:glycine dehydrogenase subunit 1
MATIYLATLGPAGLREACEQNLQKTDYAVRQVEEQTPHKVLFPAARFNEFVVQLTGGTERVQRLIDSTIVPGLPLERFYPELPNSLLVCVTETAARAQIDALVEGLR